MDFGYMVYQKTGKGCHEIEHRTGLINSKLRRLLIMIDGRKTMDELCSPMLPEIDVQIGIRELEKLHLIEQHTPTLADMVATGAQPGHR